MPHIELDKDARQEMRKAFIRNESNRNCSFLEFWSSSTGAHKCTARLGDPRVKGSILAAIKINQEEPSIDNWVRGNLCGVCQVLQ